MKIDLIVITIRLPFMTQLEQVDAEAAKLAAYNAAVQNAMADRIEANPEETIAHGRAVNACRTKECHPGAMPFVDEWDTILATRSAQEIAAFLRSSDQHTEQLRRMAPFGGIPKEQLSDLFNSIYAGG